MTMMRRRNSKVMLEHPMFKCWSFLVLTYLVEAVLTGCFEVDSRRSENPGCDGGDEGGNGT